MPINRLINKVIKSPQSKVPINHLIDEAIKSTHFLNVSGLWPLMDHFEFMTLTTPYPTTTVAWLNVHFSGHLHSIPALANTLTNGLMTSDSLSGHLSSHTRTCQYLKGLTAASHCVCSRSCCTDNWNPHQDSIELISGLRSSSEPPLQLESLSVFPRQSRMR